MGKKVPPVEIHRDLVTVCGANVMTVQHVRKWCREFDSGRVNVLDEQKIGQPSMSTDLVLDIDAAVQADRRVSIAQLEIRFNLSRGTIWDIVHERLGYRKVCFKWVPRQLTDEHKKRRMGSSLMLHQRYEEHGEAFLSRIITGDKSWVFHCTPESKVESMTWKHPHSPVKKKFKTGKLMATIFWDVHGVLLIDFTPPDSTINAAAYQKTLKRLKEAIRRTRPGLLTNRLAVLLLHDNARLHSATATMNVLNSWGWEILQHPPYSADLAPSDFHLFPKMKKHLRGHRFHSNEDVRNEIKKWLLAQDAFFL
jgi:histone-lysine N-methyltransferase SETMAR